MLGTGCWIHVTECNILSSQKGETACAMATSLRSPATWPAGPAGNASGSWGAGASGSVGGLTALTKSSHMMGRD